MTHVPKITEPRRRQARSVANDARILDAVVERLDSGGWEETSLVQIARQAGLTHPAVLDRYDSRTTAVIDAWHQRLAPPLLLALQRSIDLLDGVVHEDELLSVLEPFIYPNPTTRAAAEVIAVARYQPQPADAVHQTLGVKLDEWLTPVRGRLTRAQAARRAFIVSLALGCVMEARRRLPDLTLDLEPELRNFASALNARTFPVRLPSIRADHLHGPPVFNTDDPTLTALLAATLAEIGEFGFESATVQRIASRAGYTTGVIFSRYKTKLELFLDASERMLIGAGAANVEFQTRLGQLASLGVADATLTREFMHPDVKGPRTINFEQYRLAWHDDAMQQSFRALQDQFVVETMEMFPALTQDQARARVFLGQSRGAGVMLLADLQAGAWELPHDVVCVPLLEAEASLS